MTSKFNNVYVMDAVTIASVYEKDGPLADYFDFVYVLFQIHLFEPLRYVHQ